MALEQSTKEYFRSDNVFDAEGLKVITEITSEARRKVHTTEKQTTVAIRNKDLTTQLELLGNRAPGSSRARQPGQGSRQRAGRSSCARNRRSCSISGWRWSSAKLKTRRCWSNCAPSATSPSRPRPNAGKSSRCKRNWRLKQERRDREIALIGKAREAEIAEIERSLARRARRTRQGDRSGRQGARAAGGGHRARHRGRGRRRTGPRPAPSGKRGNGALRAQAHAWRRGSASCRSTATRRLPRPSRKKKFPTSARGILSEQQRFVLERRWEVEQEEIRKQQALEAAQIQKDVAIIAEADKREAAEIRSALAGSSRR